MQQEDYDYDLHDRVLGDLPMLENDHARLAANKLNGNGMLRRLVLKSLPGFEDCPDDAMDEDLGDRLADFRPTRFEKFTDLLRDFRQSSIDLVNQSLHYTDKLAQLLPEKRWEAQMLDHLRDLRTHMADVTKRQDLIGPILREGAETIFSLKTFSNKALLHLDEAIFNMPDRPEDPDPQPVGERLENIAADTAKLSACLLRQAQIQHDLAEQALGLVLSERILQEAYKFTSTLPEVETLDLAGGFARASRQDLEVAAKLRRDSYRSCDVGVPEFS